MLAVLTRKRSPEIDLAAVFYVPPEHSSRISDYADLSIAARAAGVSAHPFRKINALEVVAEFARIRPDYTFVFGLSQLLSPELLASAGTVIGTHPTLLPDGRGRAAIPWSILLGWEKSGISFFGITEGVDEGLIFEQESWAIAPRDDAGSIYRKMCSAGEAALERLLAKIASGTLVGAPQGTPSIGPLPGRKPEDGRIDWSKPAVEIDRLVRATTRPYPGAFTELSPGGKLIIRQSDLQGAPRRDLPRRAASDVVPGTIISSGVGGATVATGDGAIRITGCEFEEGQVVLGEGDDFSRYLDEGRVL